MPLPRAYQQQREQRAPSLSRIDAVLGLYDQALEKAQRALDALQQGDRRGAEAGVAKAKLALGGLVCTVAANTDELSRDLLRLFEFVNYKLNQLQPAALADAMRILGLLRRNFAAIRDEALRLERDGVLPPMDRQYAIQALA